MLTLSGYKLENLIASDVEIPVDIRSIFSKFNSVMTWLIESIYFFGLDSLILSESLQPGRSIA